ncbi:HigA family addiction module antitoxin [cf. Phormidesmis sp. LEGE 11477]|uniref:HigA family addiction module antitoxin n=1 Tax=cf. Phormidesmis sp. LEGE 11477 TaxID=1828680 RepID=UPI0018801AB2|nr:HigA family addiction module antitoxin [cf. Phormidesmis sp. LEGE 11477]MBE9061464.1 HigA family addiction module antidote protein [cf. Phormidesmis sp. LEGE 11477]
MRQYNPPHPGKFIRRTYIEPFEVSARQIAGFLKVSPSTFSRLIAEQNRVTPDMAIRLSKVLGRSPQSWLQMQMNHDLWQAEQKQPHEHLQQLELARGEKSAEV